MNWRKIPFIVYWDICEEVMKYFNYEWPKRKARFIHTCYRKGMSPIETVKTGVR